ncbi:unnamed protein product, partial [Ectocarpus sp. 12 AP-2014]
NEAVEFEDTAWGHTWKGLGNLVSVSEISGGPDDLAPLTEYSLGVPWELLTEDERAEAHLGLIPALIADRAEYINRPAILWEQVLSDTVLDAHGRPSHVGIPSALNYGLMDRAAVSFSASAVTLKLSVEGLLARKGSPVYGRLTDRDHKSRHPGDQGLRFVPEVMSTSPVWTDW